MLSDRLDAFNLWDAVRDTVDSRSDVGLYILTGSTIVDKKIIKHSGTGRTARMILRAWSRNISTLAKKSTMRADLVASEEYNLSMDTFDDYVGAFNKLFVINDLEAWCPPIRNKTAIRSGLKREFTDPSIAVAALGATPESLQTQLKTFGFIFENMCARDLRAYS